MINIGADLQVGVVRKCENLQNWVRVLFIRRS